MKLLVSLIFSLLLIFPQEVDKNEASGNWKGSLEVQGTSLPLVFHITNNKGKLSATLDSPDRQAFGLKMNKVNYSDKTLEMTIDQLGGRYKGTLKDGVFEGTWFQSGLEIPLKLTRIVKKGSS